MLLSNKKIKELIFGAVNIEEKSDGIHFYKCTKHQIDTWYSKEKILGQRSEATTGITLDFHTDADFVKFNVFGIKFEVYINNQFYNQYVFKDGEFHNIELNLQGNENRVTLIFPSHDTPGVLKNVEVKNSTFVSPHKFDRKILFLGDSITQGYNSKYDSLSYAYQVSDYFNAEKVINGIGGTYFLTDSFDTIDFDPDIVIIAFGVNDFFHYNNDSEGFKNNFLGFLSKIKEHYGNKKVIVTSPIYIFLDLPERYDSYGEHREFICKTAQDFGFYTVDGYECTPHSRDFYADNLHPNDLGFGIYARKLISEINKILI